ncbi:MOSC domain-containing protein [Aliiglaciecola lipolytica]|uniref:MOSC domain-containing protein 2, mitochondrial n=1 Tax=Aliiglaciecola lipolytica E3 TaxID=1127673 RepID=K6XY67_9ALTE|nr:MOSC N-terminal beta barrel domain-containing protein [Aliiglaciecola lipolytica]GAC16601.1 MOSC domain-containing protein 2, mitochondrial [Aliiglaciecola lipolytica E3]
MSQLKLSQINIYPIKSCGGISLTSSLVEQKGLEFDRRFVLTHENGKFITARTDSKLCIIQIQVNDNGLCLNAPDMPELIIRYQDFAANYQNVQVWNDTIDAQYCNAEYDQWFSRYIGKPCKLMYFGERSERQVKNSQSQVSFADSYPFLLISNPSLNELNSRLASHASMAQFRPNLVVDNCEAFAEDNWKRIRIGEVEFEAMKLCSRCIFTTIDPATGKRNADREPLNTLKSYRRNSKGEVLFGQNLIALNSGRISLNDQVVVIE